MTSNPTELSPKGIDGTNGDSERDVEVTVGITTQNRAYILPKAIESALAQDYANVRVVVMDDASIDETPGLRERFPMVQWHRNESAMGIIEGRNRLMQSCEDGYYLSLDDDAWFMRSDEISLAVGRLEEDASIAAIAFDILSPDRAIEVERSDPRPVSMFIGCGHVVRISSIRDAGYYASTPGTYGSEEKDLALRLYDMGFRIELMPGVHVWHDKAWQDRNFFPIHRSGVCNELVMTIRRCPFPDVALVIPLKMFSYLRFWIKKPTFFLAGVMGSLDALKYSLMAWRTRKPVKRSTFWSWSRHR